MYEFHVYINFPFTFNPLSCVTKNDRYEKKFRFRNFAEHSIGLSYPIYTYKSSSLSKRKKEDRERERGRKILNDHVCPTKWRLHRVSVSAFSRFSPDGPSIFILPVNLLRNLSLFIYPFSLPYPGDDDPPLPFLLRDTFSLRLRDGRTFWESANDWDCLVFYTVKGQGPPRCTRDKGSGDIFCPREQATRQLHEDRYHLCNNRRDH